MCLLACCLMVMCAVAGSASAAPLRIMTLGDSITVGYTDNPSAGGSKGWEIPFEFGYRKRLHTLLTRAGYDFVFVGASPEPWSGKFGDPTRGGAVKPSIDLRDIGQDGHRGYGGMRIPGATKRIREMLQEDNPDLILLMLGINGVGPGSGAEMDSLVAEIFTAKPSVTLIVAQITPKLAARPGEAAAIRELNAYIAATLVPKYLRQHRSISVVNQFANFLSNPADPESIDRRLFSNGINHPTNAAYDRMAATWFEGITAAIPPGKGSGSRAAGEPARPGALSQGDADKSASSANSGPSVPPLLQKP